MAALATAATLAAASAGGAAPSPWPEELLVREGPTVSSRVVDGGFLYALVSQTHTPMRGPYLLERTSLETRRARRGPRFALGRLALASGHLWIGGVAGSRPRVVEVDPRSLRVLRTISLPQAFAALPQVRVAAGPDGSVWLGTSRTLLRVDSGSGAVVARATVPARLAVADLAVDPSGRDLYVSVAHVVKGGAAGGAVLEYDARSGRILARAMTGPIGYSVAGAELTAVPGGVWASFRTGMLGLTVHLRRRDLGLDPPPGPGIAVRPADSLFHWPMSASTLYGGGSLWISNQAGLVACLNPRSGRARAIERVPPSHLLELLAVDPTGRRLFALAGSGLVRITPPRRCWD